MTLAKTDVRGSRVGEVELIGVPKNLPSLSINSLDKAYSLLDPSNVLRALAELGGVAVLILQF